MRRSPAIVVLAIAGAAGGASAQDVLPPVGFAARTLWVENRTPHGFASLAIGVASDDVFVGADHRVRQVFSDGTWQDIHALPITHDLGLLAAPVHPLELFFTDFHTDTLFRYDLVIGGLTSQPAPANAFDLVVAPGGEIIVAANPNFPAPNASSGAWLVDPSGGSNHRELIRLSGPSGPLVFEPVSGDLIVAVLPTALPPAPGSVLLLRFAASAVQQAIAQPAQPALTPAAAVATLPTDGAFDMAFDDAGRLYVSDINHRVVRRTNIGATSFEPTPFLSSTTADLGPLAFSAVTRGTFERYQPASGGRLLVGVTPLPQRLHVIAIEPARPELAATVANPIPVGPFGIELRGFPLHSNAWLCLSARPTTPELAVLPFDGRPLWLGLALTAPITSVPIALDAAGDAALAFQNNGAGISISLQAIGLDVGTPAVLASSNPLTLQLQ